MIPTETNPVITILKSIALYFTLTALGYYLALAMPSIFLLTPTAMNFAILGVMGLACAISTPLELLLEGGPVGAAAGVIMSPFSGALGSVLLAAPFFIAIACGAPAFITTSYLSWSAANISILSLSGLIFLGGVTQLIGNACGFSVSSHEFNSGGQYKRVDALESNKDGSHSNLSKKQL